MKVLEILCKLFLAAVVLTSCGKEELSNKIQEGAKYNQNTDFLKIHTVFHPSEGKFQDVTITFETPEDGLLPQLAKDDKFMWMEINLLRGDAHIIDEYEYEGPETLNSADDSEEKKGEIASCKSSSNKTAQNVNLIFRYQPGMKGKVVQTIDLSKIEGYGAVRNFFRVIDSETLYGDASDGTGQFTHELLPYAGN